MYSVSIIVPIYNKEKYLQRCLKSITNQTLKNIEIILINDGSTDNSLEICREFEEKDSRIKLIDKKNEGVSIARNLGISVASGKYIGFVDADDYIEKNMYQTMFNKSIETESEICICNYFIGNNTPVSLEVNKDVLIGEEIENEIILGMIAPQKSDRETQSIMGAVWRLIISRKLLIEKKVIFPEHIPLREDLIFCIEVLSKANRLCIDKTHNYHYITIENSAYRKFRKDFFEINLIVNTEIIKILKKLNIYENAHTRLNDNYLNIAIGSIVNEVHQQNPYKLREKIYRIWSICNDKEIQEALQNINAEELNYKRKITYNAIKYKKAAFLYFMYSVSKKFK